MKTQLPLGFAVIAIVVGTYVHAKYTERFRPRVSASLTSFAELLPTVPMRIGPWQGNDQPMDEEQFKLTNCPAGFQRRYRNRETDEVVSIYVVVGTGRNITRHSPDWCYAAEGYEQVGSLVQYTLPVKGLSQGVEFATAYFRHPESQAGPNGRGVRILWTYSDDGAWKGPTVAKLRYTINPALFKIYFIAEVSEDRSGVKDTAIPEFVEDVMPVINDTLFSNLVDA